MCFENIIAIKLLLHQQILIRIWERLSRIDLILHGVKDIIVKKFKN